ncbi:LysR family transcriptional regulator [Kaustia mangrovi]|uniref:LysR family transcriptional regulator n=1 Tax=Kaustia mangrovi TaxID=2593653 RepID=A0A7S8C3Q2_9HYPH|nr:LysR family transcriptional regulator [Kaustia mangrovi]QPC42820.1 LysR family transcriptional regulator [Kaustia mangrovi]
MNEQTMPWDDLRTVMAVARTGSLSGAARMLGLSHATVFRRLAGIEERLGVKLFDRSRRGYAPTLEGEDIAAVAEGIAAEVVAVERRVAGRDLRPSGTVRVTTTDSLLAGFLTPVFASFREVFPDIVLEAVVSNELFSLSRREADVAIRPTGAPPEALVGRRIGTIAQAVYGPAGTGDADSGPWVGWDEPMIHPALGRWMATKGVDARCVYRANTGMGLLAAVREGLGATVLPCYLADGDDRLVRLGDPVPELAVDLWLLTHPDLRRTARIRAFADFVADAVKAARPRLLGQT